MADLVNALNLPMYVVGGGVSSAWEAFAPSMFDELRKRSFVYAATAPPDTPENPVTLPAAGERTIITRALLG